MTNLPAARRVAAAALALTLSGTAAVAALAPTSAVAAGTGVPGSCKALKPTVAKFISPISVVKSLLPGPLPGHLSCEFATKDSLAQMVINVGSGSSPAQLAESRISASAPGAVLKTVKGLGRGAFSVSQGGKTTGLVVLSSTNVLYSVASTLSLAKDEALVRDLFSLT
jgi:hypothetical protein